MRTWERGGAEVDGLEGCAEGFGGAAWKEIGDVDDVFVDYGG
jgi:hypothetical protein